MLIFCVCVCVCVCVFVFFRKRAEYGFGEYGFKHRTQWVFRGSMSSRERTQWVPFSLLFVCQSELTGFFAELTEFAAELSEAQWVLLSETVLTKQYSARFLVLEVNHPPAIVGKSCVFVDLCRLLLISMLCPVLLHPVLWHDTFVPSVRCFVPSFPVVGVRNIGFCALVPVARSIRQNHPFGNRPFGNL